MGAQAAGIVAGDVDQTRLAAPEELQAHQVQAGSLDDTSIVPDAALAVLGPNPCRNSLHNLSFHSSIPNASSLTSCIGNSYSQQVRYLHGLI